jgi:neutral ceramidase
LTTEAGWCRRAIGITPRGFGMQGYGKWTQRDSGQRTPLFARAVVFGQHGEAPVIFCCMDLGYITHAMREGLIAALRESLAMSFDQDRLVLTCTHTHSGPGGCTHDIMYNVVTPGFVPEYLAAIVQAAADAVATAWRDRAPATLSLFHGDLDASDNVAWNRSLAAYRRNPDVTQYTDSETHLALDRRMPVLGFSRNGSVQALISLFGVHATCIGSTNTLYDGDNKGYAAAYAEAALRDGGAENPVAIFAQATAGDVSPHFHGPGQEARRKAISGEAEAEYAKRNGEMQAQRALEIIRVGDGQRVDGAIDAVFSYADFTAITGDPEFTDGAQNAVTSEPCHGASFFAGTPVDGPGLPKPFVWLVGRISAAIKRSRLKRLGQFSPEDRAYYERLYAAQGPKAIMQESGRKIMLGQTLDRISIPDFIDPAVAEIKRQARIGAMRDSAMVPTVLPLQILMIGSLALICAPGEFTTTAGARLRRTVAARLQARGPASVLLCTYCNDYMGYVTTFEEYQQQAYEGGHTIFGQWTLAAFQTRFAELAAALCQAPEKRTHDRTTRPAPAPSHELALRTAQVS